MTLTSRFTTWVESLHATPLAAAVWSFSVVIVAASFGLVVATLLLRGFSRWTARTDTALDDYAVQQLRSPLRWAAVLSFVFLARRLLPLEEQTFAVVRHGALITAILILGWVAARGTRVLQYFIEHNFDVDQADNLMARAAHTQVRAFGNIARFAVWLLAVAFVLMTFESVRRIGVSLLASAGLAGVVLGFAAQKSIATVFAGIQIALTQPIRIDDVVIVEGEWGRIEEIRLTYVVVRIWDLRRLVVPITYFIEHPFQNWTRTSADILGVVTIHVDYSLPVDEVRAEFRRILEASPLWDGKVCSLQVTEAYERTMLIRPLCSAKDSSAAWDLRCEVREKLIAFIRERYPECLPRVRGELEEGPQRSSPRAQVAAGDPQVA
jgi:small-conductance mechanosensitive channel